MLGWRKAKLTVLGDFSKKVSFLWRPPPQETLKRKGVFHLVDPNVIFTWGPQPKATHSFPPNKESSSTACELFHTPLFAPLVLEPNLTNKTFLILNSIKEGILQYLTIYDKEKNGT